MTFDVMGAGALNYAPCRYGTSRVLFRGPQRTFDAPYVAFLGGTETYGKFIRAPFPALVESSLGINCINFGISNAGVDVLLNEAVVLDRANGAQATVVQAVGAHNLSNRYYSVHPRRNDRFLQASPVLSSIYPEIDFAEFHFTRHMLSALYRASPERFDVVKTELQEAWLARMRLLLRKLTCPVYVLWFADHAPGAVTPTLDKVTAAPEPLFVTREMIDALGARAAGYIEVPVTQEALAKGTEGMVFSEMEAPAARCLMGPAAHSEAAQQIRLALEGTL